MNKSKTKTKGNKPKYTVWHTLPLGRDREEHLIDSINYTIEALGFDTKDINFGAIKEGYKRVDKVFVQQRLNNLPVPYLRPNQLLFFKAFYGVMYGHYTKTEKLNNNTGRKFLTYLQENKNLFEHHVQMSFAQGGSTLTPKGTPYLTIRDSSEDGALARPKTITELLNAFKQWFIYIECSYFLTYACKVKFHESSRYRTLFANRNNKNKMASQYRTALNVGDNLIYNLYNVDGTLTNTYYCSYCAANKYFDDYSTYRQETVQALKSKDTSKTLKLECEHCHKPFRSLKGEQAKATTKRGTKKK